VSNRVKQENGGSEKKPLSRAIDSFAVNIIFSGPPFIMVLSLFAVFHIFYLIQPLYPAVMHIFLTIKC